VRAASKPRRNAAEIRASVLEAAGTLFASDGYDGVSIRDIAAAAGIQPSVVIRYFGTKGALFRQLLSTFQPRELASEILPNLPKLMSESLLHSSSTEAQPGQSMVHRIAVRSLGSAEAREIIAADLDEHYIRAMARLIPAEDALARAGLVVALNLGVRLMREVVQAPALSDAQKENLRPLLQQVLAGLLKAPPPTADDHSQN